MKAYDLQHWRKVNGQWRHYATPIRNKPYGLVKGQKNKLDAAKAHFEFYKIVPN